MVGREPNGRKEYAVSNFKNQKSRAAKRIRAILDPSTGLVPRLTAGRRAMRQLAGKDRKIAALQRQLAEARGGASPEMPSANSPVFFIVGYQKSGTTWLMKMLDAHPEILCDGEGRPFGRDFRKEELKRKQAGYPPTSLYGAISHSEDLRYWIDRSVWTKRGNVDEYIDNLTRLAVEYFLTQRLAKTSKKFVGDKTVLLNAEMVKEIGKVFPDAKVIHIIRDGRDVAVSATHHVWNQAEDRGGTSTVNEEQRKKREAYGENPRELIESGEGMFVEKWLKRSAANWSERVGGAADDGPAFLGDNYTEVRYEDLIKAPEREMRRLLGFLGANSDEQTVGKCVDAASFEKLSEGRRPGEEASSFYRKGVAGDWMNVFTEQNRRDFKEKAGDLLVKLGYEEGHVW